MGEQIVEKKECSCGKIEPLAEVILRVEPYLKEVLKGCPFCESLRNPQTGKKLGYFLEDYLWALEATFGQGEFELTRIGFSQKLLEKSKK